LLANLNFERNDWRWIIPLEEPEWQVPLDVLGLLERRNFTIVGPALIRIVQEEARGSRAGAHLFSAAANALGVSQESLRDAAQRFSISSEAPKEYL
jgi:hypothetical protein